MNYDPRKLFGQHLARLRKTLGWSQEKLAPESGLARSYVSGIERGVRNVARCNTCLLATTLGLEPQERARQKSSGLQKWLRGPYLTSFAVMKRFVASWPIEPLWAGESSKICPHAATFSPRKFLPPTLQGNAGLFLSPILATPHRIAC